MCGALCDQDTVLRAAYTLSEMRRVSELVELGGAELLWAQGGRNSH